MDIPWWQKMWRAWREQEKPSADQDQERTLKRDKKTPKKTPKKAKLKRKKYKKAKIKDIPWWQKMWGTGRE